MRLLALYWKLLLAAFVVGSVAVASGAEQTATATEEPELVFHLCAAHIAESFVAENASNPGEFLVQIRLSPDGARSVSSFAREHLGESPTVRVGSRVVVKSEIMSIKISHIQSNKMTEEEAVELQRAIRNAPEEPCGPAA